MICGLFFMRENSKRYMFIGIISFFSNQNTTSVQKCKQDISSFSIYLVENKNKIFFWLNRLLFFFTFLHLLQETCTKHNYKSYCTNFTSSPRPKFTLIHESALSKKWWFFDASMLSIYDFFFIHNDIHEKVFEFWIYEEEKKILFSILTNTILNGYILEFYLRVSN